VAVHLPQLLEPQIQAVEVVVVREVVVKAATAVAVS
jgi:hypothetical protein